MKDDVNVNIQWGKENILKLPSNVSVESNASICRYLARCQPEKMLYGTTSLEEIEVEHWISFSIGPLSCTQKFTQSMEYLDSVLYSNNYLVGSQLTIADLIVWGVLQSK